MNNRRPPRISAYWLGYRTEKNEKPTPPLEETPDFVDVVVLAFALVREQNSIDLSFMLHFPHTEESVMKGIKILQKRNTKVMLSIGGFGGNCWSKVTNVKLLVANIMRIVDKWGLDGVDIDYEGDQLLDDWMSLPRCSGKSSSPFTYFEQLFDLFRSELGPNRLLTAVTAGNPFYMSSLDKLSWVFTMNYGFDNLYLELSHNYKAKYPRSTFVPFVLGVSCLQPDDWGAMTLEQVRRACRTKAPVGELSVQFWDLSEDIHAYTKQRSGIYLQTINEVLPKR